MKLVQFNKLFTKDEIINRLQENIRTALDPISTDIIFDRQEISLLVNTTDTVIPHILNRVPQGFVIIDKTGIGDVYRVSWDINNITLKSSVAVNIKLWLF